MDNLTASQKEIIHEIGDFLFNHLSEHYTLQDICTRFPISQYQLKNWFKRYYDKSVYEFVLYHRIEKAKELLIHSRLEIPRIAQLTGYKRSNNFSRIFKQKTGTTPSRYRQLRKILS